MNLLQSKLAYAIFQVMKKIKPKRIKKTARRSKNRLGALEKKTVTILPLLVPALEQKAAEAGTTRSRYLIKRLTEELATEIQYAETTQS
jgi:hypothetical protein